MLNWFFGLLHVLELCLITYGFYCGHVALSNIIK